MKDKKLPFIEQYILSLEARHPGEDDDLKWERVLKLAEFYNTSAESTDNLLSLFENISICDDGKEYVGYNGNYWLVKFDPSYYKLKKGDPEYLSIVGTHVYVNTKLSFFAGCKLTEKALKMLK